MGSLCLFSGVLKGVMVMSFALGVYLEVDNVIDLAFVASFPLFDASTSP